MNIYRLQSVEELELLQSRIKAKAKAIRVHENELRTNTGTDLNAAPQMPLTSGGNDAGDQPRSHDLKATPVCVAAPSKTPPGNSQKRARATFEHQLLGRRPGSSLEAEFLLQIKSMKQALPRLQYQVFPDRKFRLDFAWPDRKIAVLVQGNVHRIKEKFYRDCELFCLLTLAGWRYLPITQRQIKSLEGRSWLKRLLSAEP